MENIESETVNFTCDIVDQNIIKDMWLFGSWNNWEGVDTIININQETFSGEFSKNLSSGHYTWACFECNNQDECYWSEINSFSILDIEECTEITIIELQQILIQWKLGQITILEALESILLWKNGCP